MGRRWQGRNAGRGTHERSDGGGLGAGEDGAFRAVASTDRGNRLGDDLFVCSEGARDQRRGLARMGKGRSREPIQCAFSSPDPVLAFLSTDRIFRPVVERSEEVADLSDRLHIYPREYRESRALFCVPARSRHFFPARRLLRNGFRERNALHDARIELFARASCTGLVNVRRAASRGFRFDTQLLTLWETSPQIPPRVRSWSALHGKISCRRA